MVISQEITQRYYKDLREWLRVLEANDMLVRVTMPVRKETELTPLVRLQFRGLPDDQRKGFLFENVIDAKGRRYTTKVATGVYASSLKMYAMGVMAEPTNEGIGRKWEKAVKEPIEPKIVSSGPVQEVVYTGDQLLEDGKGIEALPIPVEVPGFSGQIRTSTHIITKTPDGKWRNMGNYSGHVFGKIKLLWEISRANHGWIHWNMWKEIKKPMPAAIVIGGPPIFFYVASAKLPYGVDELAVCGGFANEPIELVKCKTIDLEVPAHAEIIVEGMVSTEYMEPGNAFGEYTGYMATDVLYRPVFHVTAVTMRRDAIYVHIMSQFPPSESSKVRLVSSENLYYKYLKYDCKLPGILDVAWHEMSQAQWCVIRIKKVNNAHPWQVLHCAAGYDARWGKFYIVVDEDIDARDVDSVIWALSWRVQPDTDMLVIHGRIPGLDVSAYRPDSEPREKEYPGRIGSSAVLIDATTKYPYPPTSLPKKEFMERAIELWKELGLPELKLKSPWYGYNLGYWTKDHEMDAELLLKGEHYKIGERLEKKRIYMDK
ncbi:MAG: UbiD family decarboxylase [Aigarchaeota archaeon]|nr:UbiD family decarboxylase [Aigarchaeota archaeon]MDW8092781.1 UbiD family decarboxylase [Nitrososphaerota archaeon]